MALQKIKAGGKTYPCYQTMGAALKYNRLTGKEATDLSPRDLSGLTLWLYCLTHTACSVEGVDLPFADEQDFANHVAPADFDKWLTSLLTDIKTTIESADGEKKSSR